MCINDASLDTVTMGMMQKQTNKQNKKYMNNKLNDCIHLWTEREREEREEKKRIINNKKKKNGQ